MVLKRSRDRGTQDSATAATGAGLIVWDGDGDQLASAQAGIDHGAAYPDHVLPTEVQAARTEEVDDLYRETVRMSRQAVLPGQNPHNLVLLEATGVSDIFPA
jgi:hypothetical protein